MVDFEAVHCVATQNKVISSPPDDWTGKCLLDWIDKICQGPFYHPDIEAYTNVASVLESIYSQAPDAVSATTNFAEEPETETDTGPTSLI